MYVTPSQKITMMLNVDELNKAMQRVGATKSLPESMDGKEIAFSTHESVNYDLGTDQDHWATLTQMQAPEITVDPSVDTEKAVDAVLQLPILPSDLKEKVKRTAFWQVPFLCHMWLIKVLKLLRLPLEEPRFWLQT